MSSPLASNQPVGAGEGMRHLGRQTHRLAPAVRRQVHLQPIVLQIQRSLAVFQPVGELVVRERHVQASHRHFRPPRLAVEGKPHVGVHLAGGQILVPLFLQRLAAGCSTARGPVPTGGPRPSARADCRARSPTPGTTSATWPGRCGPPDRRSCSRRCRRAPWRGCRSAHGATAGRRSARGPTARKRRISAATAAAGS